MQIIPLVRAKYVYAYGAVLDRLGAPRRRLLEGAGLSERVLEDPEAILPAHQAWKFIGSAAQSEGIDDLGLVAGDMSIEDYGEFSQRLVQVANLNHALEAFCQLARYEYSRADFYVSRSEQATWFCRGPIDGDEVEKKHVELLVLTMMIATVRLASGLDWHPATIFLQTKDARSVEEHHLFSRSTARFGNRVTAFQVPQSLLARQLPHNLSQNLDERLPRPGNAVAETGFGIGSKNLSQNLDERFPRPGNAVAATGFGIGSKLVMRADENGYDQLKHEFPAAIRQVVGSMLVAGGPTIGSVAEAIGTSVRTLQRRLLDINTTFSVILEEARMDSANRLILQGNCTFKDIAHELGYSDQAHFTRAFRRWTGLSPGAYRRIREHG